MKGVYLTLIFVCLHVTENFNMHLWTGLFKRHSLGPGVVIDSPITVTHQAKERLLYKARPKLSIFQPSFLSVCCTVGTSQTPLVAFWPIEHFESCWAIGERDHCS